MFGISIAQEDTLRKRRDSPGIEKKGRRQIRARKKTSYLAKVSILRPQPPVLQQSVYFMDSEKKRGVREQSQRWYSLPGVFPFFFPFSSLSSSLSSNLHSSSPLTVVAVVVLVVGDGVADSDASGGADGGARDAATGAAAPAPEGKSDKDFFEVGSSLSEAGGERQEAEGSEMEKRRSKSEEKAPQSLLCSPAPGVGGGGGCFFVCVCGGGWRGERTKKKR